MAFCTHYLKPAKFLDTFAKLNISTTACHIGCNSRKNLLEFDRVNNEQREVIYKERRQVLDGDNMRDTIYKMITDVVEKCVAFESILCSTCSPSGIAEKSPISFSEPNRRIRLSSSEI